MAGWQVAAGQQITASIADPPGGIPPGMTLGARVEVPTTRAVADAWNAATLDQGTWTVTLGAIPDTGTFNFVWRTDDAEPPYYEVFIPIQIVQTYVSGGVMGMDYPVVDPAQVTPSVDDVAKLERTRTYHDDLTEVTTFDSETRPTDVECQELIQQAVRDVLSGLPSQFDPQHWPKAKRVITLYSAMLVEGSYYKEQATARGIMPWELEYNSAQTKLLALIHEDRQQNNLLGVMEPRTSATQPPPGNYWPYGYY